MPRRDINTDHLMTEVYSYPFPEVRAALSESQLDPRFMLNTLDAGQAAGMLAVYGFQPELGLPEHTDGSVNLDEIHVPVIERLRRTVGESLAGLADFHHAYPTHGSGQAIFTLMAEWHARGKLRSIAMLEGDYEGYAAYAKSLNIPVTLYTSLQQEPVEGQYWFVSNPNARDGNWLDDGEWQAFTNRGHTIVYDAAYVGLTDKHPLDVSSPHIKAVLTSPSKLFGVFRYRHTGVAYTREPVDALYGSKWFKDVPALLDTLKLYERFGHGELVEEYRPLQRLLCATLSDLAVSDVTASDVLLLAHSRTTPKPDFAKFKRADGYRFGLTKLFEDAEQPR